MQKLARESSERQIIKLKATKQINYKRTPSKSSIKVLKMRI
jgi:hypothetical protein